ncbi:N-acetylmuramic acid 6-phosphate etherase [Alteromonas sediminis]|uniref:N-acetylmuramic acid 6-phosphate etherase n=1 Tax=Alteromonas sediminis TaxID=2259342 RepID=A0A3N5ZAS0_9ALTE|nr:N-acetylmuramic acid 6-phosphate etherase [Alteromonas sediminis]RPJ66648.1 N-acetylmuramic acid 6-phosphate etherase [Alteromonas sediminis]
MNSNSQQENNVTDQLLSQLETITSECRNPNTLDIDLLSTRQIVEKINREDHLVAGVVGKALDNIAMAADKIVEAFKQGGRLVYLGAGTSGRMGILDAVECLPTFSVPAGMVVGIIAGGDKAIKVAVEGAEDDGDGAIRDLKNIGFCEKDVLVAIAASGRTPYAISGLEYARAIGAVAVAVACNKGAPMFEAADIAICAEVGPEALTGSTRMKSGTAQKMILNMLTTASMIRIGKSYENLMVDVNASNEKLRARAIRIVMQASGCQKEVAAQALKLAGNSAKLAILMVLTGLGAQDAKALLDKNHGFLRASVEDKQGND